MAVPVESAGTTRTELVAYCKKFGVPIDDAVLANGGSIEMLLARCSHTGEPDVAGVLRSVRNPTDEDRLMAARTATNTWKNKVERGRKLYLQYFHLNRGMTAMSPESVLMAAKALGPDAPISVPRVPRGQLVR